MKDIFNKDFRKLVIGLVKPIKEEFVFFVFLIVLLSPRTFYFLFTKPDKWIDFTYFPTLRFISLIFFLAWLFAWVVLLAKSKMVKKGIYIILYFLFFINLFLALNFKAAISPMTMMLLFESNIGEAEDFVATYIFTIPTFITFISVFLLMIINIILEKKKKDILKHKIAHLLIKCKVCLFVLLLLIVGGIYNIKLYPQLFACNTVEEMDAWNPGGKSSMDNITNLLFSCYDLYLMGNVLGDAVNSTLKLKNENISCVLKDSLNIILVIGESFIKNHSSLYGYELQTNPLLKKEKDAGRLIVFSDVVSPTIYTSSSIRNMLSCNSIGDGEKWHEYPFWPAIFKKAGYRVYFWDNQYLPLSNASFDFSLNSYLYHDKIKKLSYDAIQGQLSKIDSDLIGNFKAYRESKNGLGCYTLVLFHLQGQHFDVKARYPHTASFQRFAANDIKKEASWINNAKKVEIANYDNCTLFNDYVVNSIISLFQNENTVLLYLSDHGENIYDIDGFAGRPNDMIVENDPIKMRQFCSIPFFVWFSDKCKASHRDIWEATLKAADRPIMSDNICHYLMRVGGVISDYYKKNRDISSDSYNCPPRLINGKVDYDVMCKD